MPHWAPAKYGFHRPIFHDAVNQSWFDHIDRRRGLNMHQLLLSAEATEGKAREEEVEGRC